MALAEISTTDKPKDDQPHWICDGSTKIYDKSKRLKDRWTDLNEFKLEGPKGKSNTETIEIALAKNKKALLSFVHNVKGTTYFFNDRTPNESISTFLKINSEIIQGGIFSAIDKEELPKKLSLEQHFKIKNVSYILRLVCSKNNTP